VSKEEARVFLWPRSVAVVGASDTPGTWGSFVMEGLMRWKFPGPIYPVNRNGGTVYGLECYKSLQDIPSRVELAVVAVPQEALEETLEGCASVGVKGMVIISAGFGEADEEGKVREENLARLARVHGIRLLGPNVSGTFNLHASFNASGSPAHYLVPTNLAAICQGGYAFYDLLAAGGSRKMGVGWFVHTGNECDLGVTDFLELLGEEEEVQGILMYLETIRDPRRFLEVARRVSERKPIIVFKAGTTSAGARAALSHTGALAGRPEIYRGALAQAGIILCPAMELLIPLGHFLVERPPMKGDRVAIMTMGGSWGVSLVDELEGKGLMVPELSPKLQGRLRELGMPRRASTKNPVDIGAAGISYHLSLENVVQMAREILESEEVDALIFHGLGRPGMAKDQASDRARGIFLSLEVRLMREIQALEKEIQKPVVIGCCLSPWESQAVWDLNQEGIRTYQRLSDIAWNLVLARQREKFLSRLFR